MLCNDICYEEFLEYRAALLSQLKERPTGRILRVWISEGLTQADS